MIKFFFACLLLSAQLLHAQTPVYSTKNKKAIEQLELGKQLILQRKFPEAIYSFNKAIEKDDKFVEAYIALAGSYRVLRDDAQVKKYLLTAFSIQPTIPAAAYEYFYLSALLMKEGDYKNSASYLDQYLSFQPADKRLLAVADKMKATFEFAQNAIAHPALYAPKTLERPLNAFKMQYFPSLTADGRYMLFTVRNASGMQDEENLYFSELGNDNWISPQPLSARINTKENEGTASLSGDGKTMVYTYCNGRNGCDLYISKRVGKDWTSPVNLGRKVNTGSWDSQPSLSADGRTLYFSSDRPGGAGGQDIWVTTLDSTNNWTKAQNLGPAINTPESEFNPFIHANGSSLYFSSMGHVGMGGADLFLAEKTSDSTWTKPRNLGYPLNTFGHEYGLFVSSDFRKGYFSKDAAEATGFVSTKLYSFELDSSMRGAIQCIYLKGKVTDAETKKPVMAKLELTNLSTGKPLQNVFSDSLSGEYLLVIPSRENFGLFVSAPGYLYKSLNFNTADAQFQSKESYDIALQPIHKNSATTLENLFFETGKYDLSKLSETELDKLIQLIRQNKLRVEISGHTDNVGAQADNQVLSEKRAQSVVKYLIQKGLSKEHLKAKGYGSSVPVGNNTTEEGRKSNRRIVIKIME